MPKVYDTRFFVEYFYSSDQNLLKKLKEDLRKVKKRIVSAVTIHELYALHLKREGREVAKLRSETIRRDFQVVNVDYTVAVKSGEIRNNCHIPLADAVIAATAQIHTCPVVSDDPHFQEIESIKTTWYPTHT
ncbi:MAG: PIN domain-containing protein [Thermoproteota archaeon]